jgi:hypothetical protein
MIVENMQLKIVCIILGEDEDEKSLTIELHAGNLFMIWLYKK